MRRLQLTVAICLLCLLGVTARAQGPCPGTNLLVNATFEEGAYRTMGMGTSLSSYVANGWVPWQTMLGTPNEREVEYSWVQAQDLRSHYRVHGGDHAQKFFTSFGTHTAGFYQRVAVAPGSKVTFSIWAQIYTGQRELRSGGEFISDLDSGRDRGPGKYRIWAGVDPTGATPSGFGAPPSEATVWSAPIVDAETRRIEADGRQVDAWVQLAVSTWAQSDHVTVYVKGQPEFPVVHNDSFWDDACLVAERPPTSTPRPTATPSHTPVPTQTPTATETAVPTATASSTPTPTMSPTQSATATSEPTETGAALTEQPTQTSEPPSPVPGDSSPTEVPATSVPESPFKGSWGAVWPYAGLIAAILALGIAIGVSMGRGRP